MDSVAFAIIILAGGLILYAIMGHRPTQTISSGNPAVDALARAISIAEGSNPAWNNPGSLTKSFGYTNEGPQNADGVLKFSTLEDGWRALYAQINDIISGNSHFTLSDTLSSFGLRYSGNPDWAVNVARELGVTTDATLGEVLST